MTVVNLSFWASFGNALNGFFAQAANHVPKLGNLEKERGKEERV